MGKNKAVRALFWAAVLILALPEPAYAYLDPGTGSMLVSALLGIAGTVFFLFKSLWYKAGALRYRLAGRDLPKETGRELVFYSEGGQYWNTFKPVIEELHRRGKSALYLTSDPKDPGLSFESPHIGARCIGQGNRAFAVLNLLEADICVLTTPGLDVLQIRRSPGVKHYAHLVHSPTDMAIYKLYSFDYFDSVLCSGAHQMRSLRHLEALRGTDAKLLLETGCLYMDVLAEQFAASLAAPPAAPSGGKPRILLAPTWGRNGLLSRFGLDLLRPLVDSGYSLTIRPHPQSAVSEPDLLRGLKDALAGNGLVQWDEAPSGFAAMAGADVLISDLSGIVFDFALLREKPVITVRFDPDLRGLEAADLPWPAWEFGILPELGAHVPPEDMARLPEIIANLPEPEAFAARMRALRATSLYNHGRGGAAAADQLLELHAALRPSA